jgi:hypothetical protein
LNEQRAEDQTDNREYKRKLPLFRLPRYLSNVPDTVIALNGHHRAKFGGS